MGRRGLLFTLLLAGVAGGCAPRATAEVPLPAPLPSSRRDPAAEAVIGFASAQVGKRYCWGGTGPECFDCSGLVQAAWRAGGAHLPRTADAQGRMLVEVRPEEIQPGDVLWWRHHVGLYVGNGEMIDAYHSGAGVVRRRAVAPQRVLRVLVRVAARGEQR